MQTTTLGVTLIIIIITCITSVMAFNNQAIMDKLIFYPPDISQRKQWYRFFSNGLIHADIGHLAINMFCLYSFGDYVNASFIEIFGSTGTLLYLVMYVSSLAACLIPTYTRNKDNYYYRSLGASGAVSAVIFSFIMYNPLQKIGFLFVPIGIPCFIFGPLYLIVTAYLDKRGGGRINHSAHLWGALYGVAFFIVMCFALHTGFNPIQNFIDAVRYSLH